MSFVFLDMDSVLIKGESLVELSRLLGEEVYNEVREVANEALNGKLDFLSSLRSRLNLLKKLDLESILDYAKSIELMDGAREAVSRVKELGYKPVIITHSIDLIAREVAKKLDIDYTLSTMTRINDNRIVDFIVKDKLDMAKEFCKVNNVRLKECVAVGDGANDLPLMRKVGLAIGFNAKPIVAKYFTCVKGSLLNILPIIEEWSKY